jgi:hypothetical protein
VLEDIAQYTGMMMRAGVAGYPEGHPFVGPADMLDALLARQGLASHVVTQMCFSAEKILHYAATASTALRRSRAQTRRPLRQHPVRRSLGDGCVRTDGRRWDARRRPPTACWAQSVSGPSQKWQPSSQPSGADAWLENVNVCSCSGVGVPGFA